MSNSPTRVDEVRPTLAEGLVKVAEALVQYANTAGLVLTIEQVPTKPLAMGQYETRVSVRPARRTT